MSTATLTRKESEVDRQIRQGKVVLKQLRDVLEDLDDRRELAKAKKRNAGKSGIAWRDVAKELGI